MFHGSRISLFIGFGITFTVCCSCLWTVLHRGELVYAACARMGSEACWMITGCLPSGVDMGRLLEGPGCKEAHFIDPLPKQVLLSFWRTSTCTRPLEMCSMFTGGFVQFMDHLWFMFMLVDGSAHDSLWSFIWMSVRLAGVRCLRQDGLRGLLDDHRVSTQRNGH